MRAVIQRVTSAKVEVEGKVTGEIEKGFLILFGVGRRTLRLTVTSLQTRYQSFAFSPTRTTKQIFL